MYLLWHMCDIQVSLRYHFFPTPQESKSSHFCLCWLFLYLFIRCPLTISYIYKAIEHSHQSYSHPFFSPPLSCHLLSSLQTPFPHSHLFVLFCVPLSFTRVACVTFGLKLCIGTWCDHHWVHIWRQWLCLPLKPSVANSSLGRDRAWSPSWMYAWLLTGPVLWRPNVGKRSCCEIIFSMAVPC